MLEYADEVISTYEMQAKEVTLILSCLDDKRDSLVRKIDTARKMKGAIVDELYDFLIESHHEQLSLLQLATLNLKANHFKTK